MRLLLIASEPREFSGVPSRAPSAAVASLPVRWAREAHLAAGDSLLVANGAGAARAAAAAEACAALWRPDAIVSTGYCGAVDPSLAIAQIVVATEVRGALASYAAAQPAASGAARRGPIQTIGHVAQSAAEKREWRATGAIAVEMEAAGVAGVASGLGLPVFCIKAVTDLAAEELKNDFNAALRPDGRFATILLLGSAVRRPVSRIPELVRLNSRCRRASAALGDFFVRISL